MEDLEDEIEYIQDTMRNFLHANVKRITICARSKQWWKMAVAVPQRARGKAERREGPASYRGLGLVVPWLGCPAPPRGHLQRPPAPG